MINRSSNVSARLNDGDFGKDVVISSTPPPPSSTKTKERRSSRNHFVLPLFVGAFTLGIIGRPFFLPSSNGGTFPKGWQKFSYERVRHHLKCSKRSKDKGKPLPSVEDWNLIRNAYTLLVDKSKSKVWNDDPVPPTLGYSLVPGCPVPPPYYAKTSPGKGRGLFASRDITKGELVHDGGVSDVIFPDAITWREFVFSLPQVFACDCTDWLWMQKLQPGGEYHIHMGIDISGFMNSGGADWGDEGKKLVNVLPPTKYSGKFYALRDIEMGEEILTDYDMYYTNWKLVGLGGTKPPSK